jgi:hypothetical protein
MHTLLIGVDSPNHLSLCGFQCGTVGKSDTLPLRTVVNADIFRCPFSKPNNTLQLHEKVSRNWFTSSVFYRLRRRRMLTVEKLANLALDGDISTKSNGWTCNSKGRICAIGTKCNKTAVFTPASDSRRSRTPHTTRIVKED